MKEYPDSAYIKRTENMVRPDEVSLISVFGSMLGMAPVAIQKKIMASSTKKNPHMGFVVQPYAFFLCHEITDIEKAQALIPAHYKVVPSRIFADEEARPYVIFGAFTLHASAFWGNRLEMYVIAENQNTGHISWVIVDYDSNTLSFDPGQGFVAPTTSRATVTTTHRGTVLVEMDSAKANRHLSAEADLTTGEMTPLDQKLWLDGNLSVGYGGELDDDDDTPFGLVFEPEEMKQALRIPLDQVQVEMEGWHADVIAPKASVVACFPYAQHFITSQIPTGTEVHTEEELRSKVAEFNASPPSQGFSSAAIRRSMLVGASLSFLTTTSLILWLVFHYLQAH